MVPTAQAWNHKTVIAHVFDILATTSEVQSHKTLNAEVSSALLPTAQDWKQFTCHATPQSSVMFMRHKILSQTHIFVQILYIGIYLNLVKTFWSKSTFFYNFAEIVKMFYKKESQRI